MLVTSAYLNKVIKRLEAKKGLIKDKERSGNTYIARDDEDPIIPEYNYDDTRAAIKEIDDKIAKIKHAINLFNTSTIVTEATGTVDETLVRLAQLNNDMAAIGRLRNIPEKKRNSTYSSIASEIEYTYANFNPKQIEADYEAITETIADIQLKLDTINQTTQFEIDFDL